MTDLLAAVDRLSILELAALQARISGRLAELAAEEKVEAPDDFMTIEEAAFRLRVKPGWIHRRRLPFKVKVGGSVKCSREKLERWIKNRESA